MPTRKQRKRLQKERRHEYETVWVDGDGNELEEPPEDVLSPGPRSSRPDGKPDGKKAKQQQKRPQRSAPRARPAPLPPSWRRATRRALMLGGVILVMFTLLKGLGAGLLFGVVYTVLFIPFTYTLDKYAYRRWQRKDAEQPKKR
jgi:hypothetical protein